MNFRRAILAALVAVLLFAHDAGATVYFLINAATATGSAPTSATTPGVVLAFPPSAGTIAGIQSFVVNVDGTDGNGSMSCTIQVVGSNDGAHWATYGSTITASGTGTGTASGFGSVPYLYFAAYVTAISGTGAKCSVRMNA